MAGSLRRAQPFEPTSDPADIFVHYNLGNVYYRLGQYDRAMQSYARAIAGEDPDLTARAQYNLGNTYFSQHLWQNAIDAYKEAAEGGRIQVFAAEDRTGDGLIPTLAIIDELHRHRNLALYRTWAGKLAKRNGQIVTISTAGEPGTEFEATRERIRQQADQVVRRGCFTRASTARVVMHEWAIPAKGNPEDFDLVKQANPFSGITVDGLRDKYGSPTMTLGHWLRFVCNRPTRAENAAISEPEWRAARTDEAIPEGVHVSLGIDAAWKIDPFAIAPVWWKSREERIFGEAVILTPPRDGTSLDDREVERAILSIHARNPIDVVVMDPSRAEQLARWIEDEIGAEVVEQSQTNPAKVREYKRWMEGLRRGWIRHQGDAGVDRHAGRHAARPVRLVEADQLGLRFAAQRLHRERRHNRRRVDRGAEQDFAQRVTTGGFVAFDQFLEITVGAHFSCFPGSWTVQAFDGEFVVARIRH